LSAWSVNVNIQQVRGIFLKVVVQPALCATPKDTVGVPVSERARHLAANWRTDSAAYALKRSKLKVFLSQWPPDHIVICE